jgi:quinohemoprotein ethanol dehydrogenase
LSWASIAFSVGTYKFWETGGGGAPWNSMSYDPQLDLFYFGTSNGSPWNRQLRSPQGGDNLYLSSVVALHAKTGEFALAYQTTPGDTWDFDSTAEEWLLYLIDRVIGKLISAEKYATVTWAKSIDLETGRPVEDPDARYVDKMAIVYPQIAGAHNWQPTSFDPQTGLVYIPAMDGASTFVGEKAIEYKHGVWNTGVDFAALSQIILEAMKAGKRPAPSVGYIKAWDPVRQNEVWQVSMGGVWNSGLLLPACFSSAATPMGTSVRMTPRPPRNFGRSTSRPEFSHPRSPI